jgi:hypothetical protein
MNLQFWSFPKVECIWTSDNPNTLSRYTWLTISQHLSGQVHLNKSRMFCRILFSFWQMYEYVSGTKAILATSGGTEHPWKNGVLQDLQPQGFICVSAECLRTTYSELDTPSIVWKTQSLSTDYFESTKGLHVLQYNLYTEVWRRAVSVFETNVHQTVVANHLRTRLGKLRCSHKLYFVSQQIVICCSVPP